MRDVGTAPTSPDNHLERTFSQYRRSRRRADVHKGVEAVHRLEKLIQANWRKMAYDSSPVRPPIRRKRVLLPPMSATKPGGTKPRDDGLQNTHKTRKSRPYTPIAPRQLHVSDIKGREPFSEDKIHKQTLKPTKNIYSPKAAFFYDGQVSTLRMPAWKTLPSLKDRVRKAQRTDDAEDAADPGVANGLSLADANMTAGYAVKCSFPPQSNRTLRNEPRQLGVPLSCRESTAHLLSHLDELLAPAERRAGATDAASSGGISSAQTSDIGDITSDNDPDMSCNNAIQTGVVKEDDVSHDLKTLEGIVSGVYQRRPVDARRKCLVWINRHQGIKNLPSH